MEISIPWRGASPTPGAGKWTAVLEPGLLLSSHEGICYIALRGGMWSSTGQGGKSYDRLQLSPFNSFNTNTAHCPPACR